MGWGRIKDKLTPRLYSLNVRTFFDNLWHMQGATLMREVIKEGSYGVLPPGDSYDDTLPIKFVRATELKPNLQIDVASCHRVAQEYFVRKARIKAGDVLLAVKGATIASKKSVAVIPHDIGDAVINGSIFRMQFKETVLPKFAAVVLDTPILKKQMRLGLVANNGVDYLDKSLINKLIFPVPSAGRQLEVIQLYERASSNFIQATQESTKLLASIDDDLFAELGITLPTVPDSTISNRIFTAQRRELAGWRFDPLFHSFKLWHAIEEAHVPNKKLGLCCHYLKSGFAAGGDMQLFDEDGVIQLRPTNIDADRELVFDRNVHLDKSLLLAKPDDIVQYGEVLFNNTNSQELVGKTVYMNIKGQPFFCSNHITRISTIGSDLNPEYLTAVLNAYQRLKVFFSLCTNWNNQSGVNVELLRQLPIPMPGINKQEAIAEYIGSIRQQAKRLRQQAEAELESAKQQIEALLLGVTA